MDSNQNGKAIFNLQRFQILQTKLNPQTSHLIPDSYAYAWYAKLYPTLDENEIHEDLIDFFSIKKSQVDSIAEWADSEWLNQKYYTFYQYENHFGVSQGSTENIERHTLIAAFRYFYLHETFDETFWKTLISPMQYPTEASLVVSEFRSDYIYLI